MKLASSLLTFIIGVLVGGGIVSQISRHRESVQTLVILEKALRAPQETTYQGTSLTQCYAPERVEARAEIWHTGPNRQRIKYLSGKLEGFVIGCDGSRNWQSDPGRRSVTVTGSRVSDEQTTQRFDLLVRNYRVTLDGAMILAGRPVYLLTIQPRNPGNSWRRLWVDQKTFVTLRNDEYGPDSRLKSRTILEKITYTPRLDESLFSVPSMVEHDRQLQSVPASATRPLPAETLRSVYGLIPLEPGYVPSGYELERFYLYRCTRCSCGDKAALTRYVDGLNTISVFSVDAEGKRCTDTVKHSQGHPSGDPCCSLEGQTPILEINRSGRRYRVVIMGDIAATELQRIADSLKEGAS